MTHDFTFDRRQRTACHRAPHEHGSDILGHVAGRLSGGTTKTGQYKSSCKLFYLQSYRLLLLRTNTYLIIRLRD